ncbi:3' terminal RNA ribose 2'-O-methyltransferase Hen1 [Virgisporangium aurantiacum]|uniref:3' terminal RNA ribose 2'-O-methyltransferase Hen1 n=1 Tax=Virgisporangium aurantiacum TaxID=175570 RepID=UPI00194F64E4|nr:3' terminal RNA ribose 2'-O-methyltransferase Hen1 [Virgisporangium aurantiacum]
MLLTISTTLKPATDLGFLLVKHPDRVHEFTVSTGRAYVCYPEADENRCTAALVLDIDPAALRTRGRERPDDFTLGRFVNDRPYAASSLLSAAIAQVFRSALRGTSKDRPDLAATPVPLELRLPALRCRGGTELAEELFAPLGWAVTAQQLGDTRYVDLTLAGTQRMADALNQIYVLLPVLDDAKHYWVAPDEVDKLLRAGTGWLAGHPKRALIARRYLAHRRSLATEALARLTDEADDSVEAVPAETDEDAELPETAKKEPLALQRRRAVIQALVDAGAQRVLDLGCGGGALLVDLVGDRRYTEIVGVDVSTVALAMAGRRLRLDRLPERQQGRIKLLQGALTYRDDRLKGYDAAVLMEVIEHLDEPRLPALADAVFGHAVPDTVIVTTPNVEYNVRYEGLTGLRHHDHRFEWNRAAFAAWCAGVAADHGYSVEVTGVGDADPEVGAPTQMAVFTR